VVVTDGTMESRYRPIETLKALTTIRSMLDSIHQRQSPTV